MTTKVKNRIDEMNGEEVTRADLQVDLFSLDKLRVRVVGVTPLLCANPSSMQPEATGPVRGTKTKPDDSPAAVCRRAAYFDDEGNCAFPNVALYSALLTAAELMKLKIGPGGRMAPNASSFIRAGLTFDYEKQFATLINPATGEPLTEADYAIDMRRAVNPNTGGAIVAIRPRFDAWAVTFDMLIDTSNGNLMSLMDKYFDQIAKFAGLSVGLGAFRAYIAPKGKKKQSAGGPFGKFAAKIVD